MPKKKIVKKSTAFKQTVKKKSKPAKPVDLKKKSAKGAARTAKKPAKTKSKAPTRKAPLGRPKISAEEKLYLLFKEDFHARQIFAFLNAETVRDLETFRAAEIIKRLSAPIEDSVERIRRKLAEYNRYLSGDDDYVRRLKTRTEQRGN